MQRHNAGRPGVLSNDSGGHDDLQVPRAPIPSAKALPALVAWLVLVYIGEPGNYGYWGRNRNVFYSNTAAPLVEELIRGAGATVAVDLKAAASDPAVKSAMRGKHVARRYDDLLDLVDAVQP